MESGTPLEFEVAEREPGYLAVSRTRHDGPRHSRTHHTLVWEMTLAELLDLYATIGDTIVDIPALDHVQVPDRRTLVIRP